MEKKERARLREEWEKLALDWLLPLLEEKVEEAKVKERVVEECLHSTRSLSLFQMEVESFQ